VKTASPIPFIYPVKRPETTARKGVAEFKYDLQVRVFAVGAVFPPETLHEREPPLRDAYF